MVQEEQRMVNRPVQLWHNALRAVRGENTERLIEQFTAEMTLVAEGLAEDQSRVHDAVERIGMQQDRAEQRAASELQALECMLKEVQRDADARMESMERRLSALEKAAASWKDKRFGASDILNRATMIAAIGAGAWVLTSVLALFH